MRHINGPVASVVSLHENMGNVMLHLEVPVCYYDGGSELKAVELSTDNVSLARMKRIKFEYRV